MYRAALADIVVSGTPHRELFLGEGEEGVPGATQMWGSLETRGSRRARSRGVCVCNTITHPHGLSIMPAWSLRSIANTRVLQYTSVEPQAPTPNN